jgi:pilus assembly protein CpaC
MQLSPALQPVDPGQSMMPVQPLGAPPASEGEPIPPQVESMPAVTTGLKIIHRRSQVLRFKQKIARTAIADPSVMDIVPFAENEIMIVATQVGTTTMSIWFEGDYGHPLIYLIDVIRDPSLEERTRYDYGRLEEKIRALFPNSKVYLIPISGKVIVKGQAYDAKEAAEILRLVAGEVINQLGYLGGPQQGYANWLDPTSTWNPNDLGANNIINMLSVPGEFQIQVTCRIAELQRSALRRLGVDFTALINNRVTIGSFMSGVAAAGAAGAQAGGANMAAVAASGATLSGIYNNGQIITLINALQAQGYAKLLAEPSVTVMSGHPASFLSGGEFAVPTIIGVGGAAGQQTTFRGYGTSVIVTPTILDKDLIRLQVLPEFSEVNNGNRVMGIPGLNARRVQTTVELREGQTLAIGGLLSNRELTQSSWIPFLGEIPFIGTTLFTNKYATKDQNELLILVTPELVRPMDADEVPPVPGYEVTHPNDWELYLYGRTEGTPDRRVHQLAPYGHGSGQGVEVGHTQWDPTPAQPGYRPQPTNPYGAGAPGVGPLFPTGQQMPVHGGFSQGPMPGMSASGVPGPTPPGGYRAVTAPPSPGPRLGFLRSGWGLRKPAPPTTNTSQVQHASGLTR